MSSAEKIQAYKNVIKLHRDKINQHKTEWKLTPTEERMLEVLERQADEAESEDNYEKAISILHSISLAIHLKEGENSHRTKGISEKAPSRAKVRASGK